MFSADLGGYTAPLPAATDPPFQKVALLLHGDGTNGAQNNTFVDSSTNNFSITRTGNVAQGTFSPFSLAEGQWSNYFDGTGDSLTLTDGSSMQFGTSDFTMEFFVYLNSVSSDVSFIGRANPGTFDVFVQYRPSLSNALRVNLGSSYVPEVFAWTPSANTWYHIAVTRSGTSLRAFVNGVQIDSTITNSTNVNNTTAGIGIGFNKEFSGQYLNGYISNLRVVKGTALYTSNFTSPTSALTAITNTSLLTCQSNRFKDNSSNNFTITPVGDTRVTAFSPFAPSAAYDASTNGGSGYFDGSGDYLQYAASSAFAIGTNDFTIEAFVYPMGKSTNYPRIMNGGLAEWNTTDSWALLDRHNDANTKFGFAAVGIAGNTLFLQSSSVVKDYQWYHIAVTRSGTTFRLFINGVLEASYTSSASLTTSATVGGYIQHFPADSQAKSYISNARIVKGTAVYTSNFTPPTSPLTAIFGTSLLLNCTNAGIIDNSGKNDIETVGNAQISTSVKKYGTGSMYFDGTGDYLVVPNSPNIQFGSGDFTIEFWINTTSSVQYDTLVSKEASVTTGNWNLLMNSASATSGDVAFWSFDYNGFSIAMLLTTGVSIRDGNWHHVALVRNGSNWVIYIDGTSRATTTSSITIGSSTNNIWVANVERQSGRDLNGYIDDLRITKGQALYTSNFTPPAQAFPNV